MFSGTLLVGTSPGLAMTYPNPGVSTAVPGDFVSTGVFGGVETVFVGVFTTGFVVEEVGF
jgi:hypothetical protein